MGSYLNSGIIRFQRLLGWGLKLGFGLDIWEVSPLRERPYAMDIVTYLNRLHKVERVSVVEIGCGMGTIIRRLKFQNRTGLDYNPRIIRAARFLKLIIGNWGLKLQLFDFPSSELSGRHNVILMVNWIHQICPEVLKRKIEDYSRNNLCKGGMIVIDIVQHPGYRYNHDASALTDGLICHVIRLGMYSQNREIYVIKPFAVPEQVNRGICVSPFVVDGPREFEGEGTKTY
jgi:SAM-dependent methyltransferase